MVCWRLSKINTIPRSHLKFGGSTYNALIKKIGDKPPAAGQVYTLEHLGKLSVRHHTSSSNKNL